MKAYSMSKTMISRASYMRHHKQRIAAYEHVRDVLGDKLYGLGWHIVIPPGYSLAPYLYEHADVDGVRWIIHICADRAWHQDSRACKLAKTYAMVNTQIIELNHVLRRMGV